MKKIIISFCIGVFVNSSFAIDYPGKDMPNIIIILADDLGYGDVSGYYGGQAKTPHLNRLAHEGMLFTDFHSNGPMCSPTRAALLTGRYQQKLGIERVISSDWTEKGIGSEFNKNELTIAEYLSNYGYATSIMGKWHLGRDSSANPIYHGFDEFKGSMGGSIDYFTKIDRNGYKDWWNKEKLSFQDGYNTKVITENSIDFILSNKQTPFFLYLAYTAIHFPWQTSEDYNLETVQEGEDYSSNYPGPRSKLGPHLPEQIPSVVIKMIEELDKSIGRIIEMLHEQGLDENTLVFFTSDNGGYINYNGSVWPKVGSNGLLRGQKGQLYEGGHRVPAIAWWPGKIPALSVCDETAMTFDLLPTVLDILNIPLPTKNSLNSIDGVSLLPTILDNKPLETRTLFWRMSNQKAVRSGKWKLIFRNKKDSPELYNLTKDIGETKNLASRYPEKVFQLKSKLEVWENDVNAEYHKKQLEK